MLNEQVEEQIKPSSREMSEWKIELTCYEKSSPERPKTVRLKKTTVHDRGRAHI